MVERRSHVPARLHETKGQGHRELSGVDRPSHINVVALHLKRALARLLPEFT
jgi:hypothetical protein